MIPSLIRVAFVDDEANILRGIRRSMADMESQWDMTFCESAADALALMQEKPFDVVVSDMRMPHMDGAELLSKVRSLYPATLRLILSGYADSDSVLRTVGPAHTYLAKPCNADILRDAIQRQLSLRFLLNSPQLRAILAGISSLPSLPDLYIRLQGELASQNSSVKSVAAIIEQDVAMTAAVLKLTNSAYFSTAGAATSPLHAVRLLGMETIQALVLNVGVFRQFSGKSDLAPLLTALTMNSLAISRLAENIVLAERGDNVLAKAAQVAAMLGDIGSVVLLDSYPDKYRALLAEVGGEPLHIREEKVFGAHHGLIGAYLLGLWGFSETIVEAVAYCAQPSACPRRDNLALTAFHAARALGPPSPLLPKDMDSAVMLDMPYLVQAVGEGRIEAWTDMVHSGGGK